MKMQGGIKNNSRWGLALLLSLVFNLSLFSIMPHLILNKPVDTQTLLPIDYIDVIRIKKPDDPVKKKPPKKKQPEKEAVKNIIRKQTFSPKKPTRLKMPFELNTKLSEGPGTIPSLFMEKYALDGLEAYEIGDIDQPITAIVKLNPVYPMRARRLGIEGYVTIKLLISEEGLVEQTEILKSQPEGVFESSVLHATSSWKFTPGTIDGRPVKTFVTTTIRFDLKNE